MGFKLLFHFAVRNNLSFQSASCAMLS